ncbi:MAG: chemotaxis protein [Alphaproteobacteria bacterium]|nr:chemotaxis protein [Alphaproteobacteria bacterium]
MALSGIDVEIRDRLAELQAEGAARVATADIGGLGFDEIREAHIPSAKDELTAIVAETETATDTIMSAAEQIEKLAGSVDAAVLEQIAGHVMNIYQACSFQDITGQRVTKVTQVLATVESVADTTLAALGDELARQRVEEQMALQAFDKSEDADLLNGPQLEGGGNSQDDIDSILASFD